MKPALTPEVSFTVAEFDSQALGRGDRNTDVIAFESRGPGLARSMSEQTGIASLLPVLNTPARYLTPLPVRRTLPMRP